MVSFAFRWNDDDPLLESFEVSSGTWKPLKLDATDRSTFLLASDSEIDVPRYDLFLDTVEAESAGVKLPRELRPTLRMGLLGGYRRCCGCTGVLAPGTGLPPGLPRGLTAPRMRRS